MSEIREARNELAIKVAETDESADVSEFLRSSPFVDPFQLSRVHSYYTMLYYHSKEIDFFFIKGAFGGFEE